MSILNAFINKLFQKNFNTIFIKNIKSCEDFFFSFSHKKFLKIFYKPIRIKNNHKRAFKSNRCLTIEIISSHFTIRLIFQTLFFLLLYLNIFFILYLFSLFLLQAATTFTTKIPSQQPLPPNPPPQHCCTTTTNP